MLIRSLPSRGRGSLEQRIIEYFKKIGVCVTGALKWNIFFTGFEYGWSLDSPVPEAASVFDLKGMVRFNSV